MNFNKLGIAVLSAGAIFMATSCNKTQTLSYDKALEWVQNHYKETGALKVTSEKVVVNFSNTKGDTAFKNSIKGMAEYEALMFANVMLDLGDSLKITKEFTAEDFLTEKFETYYMNEANFQGTFRTHKDNAKFTISNNELTGTYTYDVPDGSGYAGKITETYKYDSKGAWKSYKIKNANFTAADMDGTANGYFEVNYKYE